MRLHLLALAVEVGEVGDEAAGGEQALRDEHARRLQLRGRAEDALLRGEGRALRLQLLHAPRLHLEVGLARREVAQLLQHRLLLDQLVLAHDHLRLRLERRHRHLVALGPRDLERIAPPVVPHREQRLRLAEHADDLDVVAVRGEHERRELVRHRVRTVDVHPRLHQHAHALLAVAQRADAQRREASLLGCVQVCAGVDEQAQAAARVALRRNVQRCRARAAGEIDVGAGPDQQLEAARRVIARGEEARGGSRGVDGVHLGLRGEQEARALRLVVHHREEEKRQLVRPLHVECRLACAVELRRKPPRIGGEDQGTTSSVDLLVCA